MFTQVFKDIEVKMAGHNQKLQTKLNQLGKRESRLVLLEEELKQKIGETSRQLAYKDAESEEQKAKWAEEKKALQKKVKELEDKNKKLEDLTKSLEEDFRLYKIAQENSPIEVVRKELSERIVEITSLRKELEKTDEIKEEYRKHFDRLKEEVLRLKKERDQALIEANTKHDSDLQQLKKQLQQIGATTGSGPQYNYDTLRQELWRLRGGSQGTDAPARPPSMTQPLPPRQDYPQLNTQELLGQRGSAQSQPESRPAGSHAYPDSRDIANITRLKNERSMLLKQGYQESDPLVQKIDEAMRKLKAS